MHLHTATTLNCKGRLLDLSRPLVMGILNTTPDSFYDGGRFVDKDGAMWRVEQMLEEGATIIDIGGMSSRPGATLISADEELRRVMPIVEAVVAAFPQAIFSIDTVRARVARAAVEAGVHIVNDISAGRFDEDLLPTVAELGVPYVLMHMQGTPADMQRQPQYEDVVVEILDFLIGHLGHLRALGVRDVIVDPGFGFGKTIVHNYQLLKNLAALRILGCPVLVGLSRKRMICQVLGVSPREALNGTTALHMVALQQGASILRVHDVAQAMEVVQLWEAMQQA